MKEPTNEEVIDDGSVVFETDLVGLDMLELGGISGQSKRARMKIKINFSTTILTFKSEFDNRNTKKRKYYRIEKKWLSWCAYIYVKISFYSASLAKWATLIVLHVQVGENTISMVSSLHGPLHTTSPSLFINIVAPHFSASCIEW